MHQTPLISFALSVRIIVLGQHCAERLCHSSEETNLFFRFLDSLSVALARLIAGVTGAGARIKAPEALTVECFLAARAAGVEAEVVALLEASDTDIRWRERGSYNLERVIDHGVRRAAEMREATKIVAALRLPSVRSGAASEWQHRIAALCVEPGADDLKTRLHAVLSSGTVRGDHA